MPRIIDYPTVRDRMALAGFVSLYHNSGAFGFARGTDWMMRGWLGPDDPTIRAEVRPFVTYVPQPHAVNLAKMFVQVRRSLPGVTWLMPKSHWHFELHDGHRELLESLLPELGINPALLRERNDGSAIEFLPDEDEPLRHAVERLLDGLRAVSDFSVALPDGTTVCTVHHHVQLWWQTTRADVIKILDGQSTQSSS